MLHVLDKGGEGGHQPSWLAAMVADFRTRLVTLMGGPL